jgi:heterodisulfide reductase subunit B
MKPLTFQLLRVLFTIPDPSILEVNHAGDEFRENQEVMDRFFDAAGNLKPEEVERLHQDIGHLLLPSRERALQLNKAYRAIVQEQSFIHGRDATVTPAKNVHQQVEQDQPTEVELVLSP